MSTLRTSCLRFSSSTGKSLTLSWKNYVPRQVNTYRANISYALMCKLREVPLHMPALDSSGSSNTICCQKAPRNPTFQSRKSSQRALKSIGSASSKSRTFETSRHFSLPRTRKKSLEKTRNFVFLAGREDGSQRE